MSGYARCEYCGNGENNCLNPDICDRSSILVCCCCVNLGKPIPDLPDTNRFTRAIQVFMKLDQESKEEFLEWAIKEL